MTGFEHAEGRSFQDGCSRENISVETWLVCGDASFASDHGRRTNVGHPAGIARLSPSSGWRGRTGRGADRSLVSKPETQDARDVPRTIEISNLVVATFREFTGRGPTRARTYLQDDLVNVVLRDSLTKGEQHLVAEGKGELVVEMRQAFQQAMRDTLIAGIERITGREVIAFLSANHLDPDFAVETFVLRPNGDSKTAAERS